MIDSLRSISATNLTKQALPEPAYMSLLAIQKPLTLEMAATAPTLRTVREGVGEGTTVKLICAALKLFNDGLNTTLQMSARQLFEYGQLFVETFPHETLKDLILCLKQVKMGQYGPIYNRVDGSVVSDFFRQYLAEKATWLEEQHRKTISEANRANGNLIDAMPEAQREKLRRLTQKPTVRLTMHMAVSSEVSYANWLRENAETIDFEVLTDIQRRANPAQNAEVLAIATSELKRRQTTASAVR